jgi:DNA invertase Pin-like site-specific DNA recombinase
LTGAVGYVRVSTAEQAGSGLGVDAQRAAIVAACAARGLTLTHTYTDAGVSSAARSRPALDAALWAVEAAPGRVLVVAKLDRLARSLTAYAALVDRSRRRGWQLLALDAPEAATPQGEAMQAMVAVFAQLERRLISQRTVDALAAARARGVQLGRPPLVAAADLAIITRLWRRKGLSARAIARELTAAGVPGPMGGAWDVRAVLRALRRAGVDPGRRRRTHPRRSTVTPAAD